MADKLLIYLADTPDSRANLVVAPVFTQYVSRVPGNFPTGLFFVFVEQTATTGPAGASPQDGCGRGERFAENVLFRVFVCVVRKHGCEKNLSNREEASPCGLTP